jgi:integrase
MRITSHTRSRQPPRKAWPRERLLRERAIALGLAIDTSTLKTYSSHLNSYLTFVRLHDLPVEPNPDTLSFYVVFMSHHIEPRCVSSYLSGICHQLEPFFPNVRASRHTPLVDRTMKGCLRLKGTPTKRKRALTLSDLKIVLSSLSHSTAHDDLLFKSMLLTGFFALMRLGELTFPNSVALRNWKKITKRSTVTVSDDQYEFHLPGHKADPFFEGNRIIIKKKQYDNIDPLSCFREYLHSRDVKFPLSSPLWLTSKGSVPTRDFFIKRLHLFFDRDIAGQSMRAGGATSLAEHGVPPSLIQFIGRWSSDAFFIYIRKSPVLIQALLYTPS